MKKIFPILIIVLTISTFLAAPALANSTAPVGGCPPGFELHPFMDHSGDPAHQHIGVDRDRNGDGNICMKMLPNDLHLHVDNSIPLK